MKLNSSQPKLSVVELHDASVVRPMETKIRHSLRRIVHRPGRIRLTPYTIRAGMVHDAPFV